MKERSDSTSSYGMSNDVFESVDAHGKYKVSNLKNFLIFTFCKIGYYLNQVLVIANNYLGDIVVGVCIITMKTTFPSKF